MTKILIIDDDIFIGNMLEETLKKENYEIIRAYSGTEARYVLSNTTPDLVLLDLMLPGLSGEELIKEIENIPIIVMSAKVDVEDKVKLLVDGGANDYITKPFDIKELIARVKVQLRNCKNIVCAKSSTNTYEKMVIDENTHMVTIDEQEIRLTRTEYAILKLLIKNPQKVYTKSEILDYIAYDTPDCTESSLKQHISNLRKKLKTVDDKEYIEAIWGIGFKMKAE